MNQKPRQIIQWIEWVAGGLFLGWIFLFFIPGNSSSPYAHNLQQLIPLVQGFAFLSLLALVVLILILVRLPREDWNLEDWCGTAATIGLLVNGVALRLITSTYLDPRLPSRMGGLFLEFAQQIAASGFSIPQRIPYYTEGGIPFAYPPLPFYVEAILLNFFPKGEFLIANLLPPFIGILTLFSFIYLVHVLDLDPLTGTLAIGSFAFMLSAFYDQSESAGLAEAFGNLSLVWYSISLVKANRRGSLLYYVWVGGAFALCVLSSPGSAYASIFLFFLFAISQLLKSSQKIAILARIFTAGVVATVATSPYWLAVISNHGIGLFWHVVLAQQDPSNPSVPFPPLLIPLLEFRSSLAPFPSIWGLMILSGFIWALFHRHIWLPVWLLALILIPREGWWMSSVPASLLAGYGASKVWGPFITSSLEMQKIWKKVLVFILLAVILAGYVLINTYSLLIPQYVRGYDRSQWIGDLEAMRWVSENTPKDSRIIVLADNQLTEWTAHVMKRTVLNIPQGAEWEPEKYKQITIFQGRTDDCRDLACVLPNVKRITDEGHVYLYIQKKSFPDLFKAGMSLGSEFEFLWKNKYVLIGRLEVSSPAP
jgi:hypothetical protein